MPVLDNPKYELFARNRVAGMNATKAYIAAGYSELGAGPNAKRLTNNDQIKQRIAELHEESLNKAVEKMVLTEAFVIEGLSKLALACSDREATTWNPQAANRSLELLGKKLAIFTDRIDDRRSVKELKTKEELDLAAADIREEIKRLEDDRKALVAASQAAADEAQQAARIAAPANDKPAEGPETAISGDTDLPEDSPKATAAAS